ncbi:MAG: SGNH/GDSL hydrolase family protein [Phototrophicales bacterium]|nr:SGNH/GDSL hydrolase family protein [Phototrophicales bacterium]
MKSNPFFLRYQILFCLILLIGLFTISPALAQDDTSSDDLWQTLPVIPTVSDTTREIYQRGIEMGNNPNAFGKVGDCQNVHSYFLGVFDTPEEYALGEDYAYLQEAIDHFSGSFIRNSEAVDNGFNVASVLSPLWSSSRCEPDENPNECENRQHNPSIVIISMETWWTGEDPQIYEDYLAETVEYWINEGVVPILATKADNLEGDHGINRAIANVARRYDIPLWNFWLAVQSAPNGGLADGFHLTFARNFFNDPERMQAGWVIRNLTALQSLDAVWRGVQE